MQHIRSARAQFDLFATAVCRFPIKNTMKPFPGSN